MATTELKKLRAAPLRSMNAYFNIYDNGAGEIMELVSYCTPVVWAVINYKGNIDCIIYSPAVKCRVTTSRHVSTFIREILRVDAPTPSKKIIDALEGNKVLYTYADTNFTPATGFVGDLGDAPEFPYSIQLNALRPARKGFYNEVGFFVPGEDWRA